MSKKVKNEPYQAHISEETLVKWRGIVSVWSAPAGPPDGAEVVDEIREPIEVTVAEEQMETSAMKRKMAKIKYGNDHEGWILSEALT